MRRFGSAWSRSSLILTKSKPVKARQNSSPYQIDGRKSFQRNFRNNSLRCWRDIFSRAAGSPENLKKSNPCMCSMRSHSRSIRQRHSWRCCRSSMFKVIPRTMFCRWVLPLAATRQSFRRIIRTWRFAESRFRKISLKDGFAMPRPTRNSVHSCSKRLPANAPFAAPKAISKRGLGLHSSSCVVMKTPCLRQRSARPSKATVRLCLARDLF